MAIGIVSYGGYVPRYRIKIEEIARVWGRKPEDIRKGLKVFEKSVPDVDEDTVTIAVEAARNAVRRVNLDAEEIGAVFVGSESHPYAVKPTATVVAEALCVGNDYTAADYEFACKAGTAAVQTCMGLVQSGMIKYGLAIGSDVSQAAPGDALEYSSGAGGVALIIGSDNLMVEIEGTCSFTTDTPDFWRRAYRRYPEHGGRFTGQPAYFKHVISASERMMERMNTTPEDYDYVVLHQPNGKFPVRAARKMGFTDKQTEKGIVITRVGNTYSASCLLGLAAVLDEAEPGSRILLTSFGSGAGSDSFSLRVTDGIKGSRGVVPTFNQMMENLKYLDYAMYAKHVNKIVKG